METEMDLMRLTLALLTEQSLNQPALIELTIGLSEDAAGEGMRL